MININMKKKTKKTTALIINRDDHNISRKQIDEDALKVLYRLKNKGYLAYLVGGCVRDMLLGLTPKDFDVVTDAHPNKIKKAFGNCFLIGRRFRLAHIIYGKNIIETSTFRSAPEEVKDKDKDELYQHHDNTFGTPEEDARRRDFTINAIYYSIHDFSLIDYVGGMKDMDKKIIRTIGKPAIRFQEDPVRMIRAIRFASKLSFDIEPKTYKAIVKYRKEILKSPPSRLYEDISKLFMCSASAPAFKYLYQTKLIKYLIPEIYDFLASSEKHRDLFFSYLKALDKERPNFEGQQHALNYGILFYPLFLSLQARVKEEHPEMQNYEIAKQVINTFASHFKMPKKVFYQIVNAYDMQKRFDVGNTNKNFVKEKFTIRPDFPLALAIYKVDLLVNPGMPDHSKMWESVLKKFPPPPEEKRRKRRPNFKSRKPRNNNTNNDSANKKRTYTK
jgi:poly(A) polymerase